MEAAPTVEDHLRDKPPSSVALFGRFVELIEACGPVTWRVERTMISFHGTRRKFAGAFPSSRGLAGFFDLQRQVQGDPRIRRANPYTKRLFVHGFRVTAVEELDDQFASWLCEAYKVGQGAHMQRPL